MHGVDEFLDIKEFEQTAISFHNPLLRASCPYCTDSLTTNYARRNYAMMRAQQSCNVNKTWGACTQRR